METQKVARRKVEENLWQEVSPSKKQKPRALIKNNAGSVHVLLEIGKTRLKTTKGGRIVMIAEAELNAENLMWIGDRWVKPRVICKVYARFTAKDVIAIKRRDRMQRNAKNSPVLHTDL